jgi:light-regulated signal transduction histidine kinase (bacteriophytochrome)
MENVALPNRHDGFIQSMLDASMHGIILLRPVRNADGQVDDFMVVSANVAIKSQVGINPEEITGRRLADIFPSYRALGYFQLYVTTLESRLVQRKELYYEDKRVSGWFDLSIAPYEDMLVINFVNTTERKEYQQAIQRYAAQLYTIIDTAQSGMFLFSPVKDSKGKIVDFKFSIANKALAAYVGQDPQALIGELGSKWFPAYKKNGLFELYKETCETGKINRFDFHYNDDNIDVWLDIMSTRFEKEVLVTFTDYTSLKRLQLQLESSVNELKRSNAYLEEFAYAASHDLQEPLRKIQFYSDKVKLQVKENQLSETISILERMDTAANRMRVLIDDLLAFSQLSSEQIHFQPVNLQLLFKELITDLETTVKEKGAVVDISELPVVMGYKRQLQQLFQNLLTNSLKYTRAGAAPEIQVKSELIKGKEAAEAIPPGNENSSYYLIEVKDNGLGFEQQYAKKIFHIFQRLHGRSEYPGTGVGLAIVQKVVENHKGFIIAEGKPDHGATFKVFLPVEAV